MGNLLLALAIALGCAVVVLTVCYILYREEVRFAQQQPPVQPGDPDPANRSFLVHLEIRDGVTEEQRAAWIRLDDLAAELAETHGVCEGDMFIFVQDYARLLLSGLTVTNLGRSLVVSGGEADFIRGLCANRPGKFDVYPEPHDV